MFEFLKLYVGIVLKSILTEPVTAEFGDSNNGDDEKLVREDNQKASKADNRFKPSVARISGRLADARRRTRESGRGEDEQDFNRLDTGLLDLSGPKLICGLDSWLFAYKLFGQINWTGIPVFLSILYRLLALAFMSYNLLSHILIEFYNLHVFSENIKNPIFMLISSLSFLAMVGQILVSLKVNSFDLRPMYKILTTPKLCFVKPEVLLLLGTGSLLFEVVFSAYNTLIMSMLSKPNYNKFIEEFHLPTFLVDMASCFVVHLYMLGLSFIDLYIRSAYGFWLLDLKNYLGQRFTYLHQRESLYLRRSKNKLKRDGKFRGDIGFPSAQPEGWNQHSVTLDQIQANLNHMDDHLEVLRSVQEIHLLLTSLNAFLGNGGMFLLSYHLLAVQKNFYHGFLCLGLAANFIIFSFLSYFGDSWLFYALSSFVQTVEDEYFMQSDAVKSSESKKSSLKTSKLSFDGAPAAMRRSSSARSEEHQARHQQLMIKKKDVLFCREFLHQFESHLGTAWVKLSLTDHIHMLRAFVTLIAAQIIFDHQH